MQHCSGASSCAGLPPLSCSAFESKRCDTCTYVVKTLDPQECLSCDSSIARRQENSYRCACADRGHTEGVTGTGPARRFARGVCGIGLGSQRKPQRTPGARARTLGQGLPGSKKALHGAHVLGGVRAPGSFASCRVHGSPWLGRAGARAAREAVNARMQNHASSSAKPSFQLRNPSFQQRNPEATPRLLTSKK